MKRLLVIILSICVLLAFDVHAQEISDVPPEKDSKSSPWLISPLFSSDPKLSTAFGVLAGYVKQFDEKSPPSLIGVAGAYTTTDSWYLTAFAKVHFGSISALC